MVDCGLIHYTQPWTIQHANRRAIFVSSLQWIPERNSGCISRKEFGLLGRSPCNKKTRNVILILILVLIRMGVHGGINTRELFAVAGDVGSDRRASSVMTHGPRGPSRPSIGKAARPLAPSVMTGLNPRVKTTIPMFYINLAADQDRAAYMEYVYSGAGNSLIRISAINGTDRDMLRRRLAMDHATLVEYDNASAQRTPVIIRDHFKALPNQIGNLLSHLDAIYTAHQNPATSIALVMEDNVGDFLTPFWPGKLDDLASLADAIDPEWAAVRLQWHDTGSLVDSMWSRWVSEFHQWSKKVGGEAALLELHNTWRRTGRLPIDSKPPLILPYASGWGAVATLYSRRGMDALINQHFAGLESDELPDWGDNVGIDRKSGGLPRWNCSKPQPCVSDLSFWPTLEPHAFIATPPWFTYRLAEVQTRARILHLTSVARALQWIISFDDGLKPGGGPNVPWDTAWHVLKTENSSNYWVDT